MVKTTELQQWLHDENVFLFDRPLSFSNEQSKAATINLKGTTTWGIFLDTKRFQSKAEELAALLHESGHYATGATHELASPLDLIKKHENKADKWAITRAISEQELENAVDAGYTEIWSLAEFFGVTEDFMKKAICWYKFGNLDVESYFGQ